MNYFKHKMRAKTPLAIAGWILLGITAAIAFAILFGYLVMWLWNNLIPDIFGLGEINYWQAIGLFILAKILCGGFGGSSSNSSAHKKQRKCSDNELKKSKIKWELYDKFWQEEGESAYQDFIKRKNGHTNDDTKA